MRIHWVGYLLANTTDSNDNVNMTHFGVRMAARCDAAMARATLDQSNGP